MGTVKGDPSHPAPPDAIPQTGLATSGYAQATSAVASGLRSAAYPDETHNIYGYGGDGGDR